MTSQSKEYPFGSDPRAVMTHVEDRLIKKGCANLPIFAYLAETVEARHQEDDLRPRNLGSALRALQRPFCTGAGDERILVHAALDGDNSSIADLAVQRLLLNHAMFERAIADIECVTAHLTLPNRACAPWQALYGGLGSFVQDLRKAIALQREVIVPALRAQAA